MHGLVYIHIFPIFFWPRGTRSNETPGAVTYKHPDLDLQVSFSDKKN